MQVDLARLLQNFLVSKATPSLKKVLQQANIQIKHTEKDWLDFFVEEFTKKASAEELPMLFAGHSKLPTINKQSSPKDVQQALRGAMQEALADMLLMLKERTRPFSIKRFKARAGKSMGRIQLSWKHPAKNEKSVEETLA